MATKRSKNRGRADTFRNEVVVGVSDMVLLTNLSNKGIVANLKERLASELIYSYIGNVLVAVNPYKWLNLYDATTLRKFVNKNRVDVPPHIFSVGEAAYRSMLSEEENQCVIISGESGAGKTEASKQIQSYVAGVSGSGGDEAVERVKRVFLDSNPVLEAFGNAKTLRNNNSSRFGKYFELFFDRFGRPMGGKVSNFLHEKSRVVKPGLGERNFHIFYQLLAAPSEVRKKYDLKSPDSYHYLRQSGCNTVDGVDDGQEFEATKKALSSVGFGDKLLGALLGVVAGILHLGNVSFSPKKVGDAEGSKVDEKATDGALDKAAGLFGIDASALKKLLCSRRLQTMAPGGNVETYDVPQNPVQAMARRDAVAKRLFERLFDLIVERVNAALDVEKTMRKAGRDASSEDILSLGVLDIYGFEIFEKNGFEQLCINYVNEKLQQIFISLTLKAEQDEYDSEGIAWTPIAFFNNKVVCDLIEGSKPPGLFRILDDTCKTMHSRGEEALDRGFLDSAGKVFSGHEHYQKLGGSNPVFVIQHFAGSVEYSVAGFGEANKDILDNDLILLLQGASPDAGPAAQLLPTLFPEEIDLNDKRLPKTTGFRIRTQCGELVQKLSDCSPHYVRCVKPNDDKRALHCDDARVAHQAQYLGLLENIRVRRAGFAYRAEFHRFAERFALLSPETWGPSAVVGISDKEAAKAILRNVKSQYNVAINKEDAQLGRSKLFVRSPETYFELERLRSQAISFWASKIQRVFRKFVARRHLIKFRDSMGKLYEEAGKRRRRGSFSRPYDGDYLQNDDVLRDCMVEVVSYYEDDGEGLPDEAKGLKIEYVDIVKRVEEISPKGEVVAVKHVICLTKEALYLFAEPTAEELEDAESYLAANGKDVGKNLPPLMLRRRVGIDKIRGLELSKLADDFLAIRFDQEPLRPAPDKSNWVLDKDAPTCQMTGKPFSLFTRRHHCRFTGGVFVSDACCFTVPLPDLGWYTPQRIGDESLGLPSTEVYQDWLILSDRKTELAATIKHICECEAGKGKKKGREVAIRFSDTMRLAGGQPSALSMTPSLGEIVFREGTPLAPIGGRKGGKKGGWGNALLPQGVVGEGGKFDATLKYEEASRRYVVMVPRDAGLSDDVLLQRSERLRKMQKKLEKRRKAERELRQAAAAEREGQREAERQERLAEKRRKKAAAKAQRDFASGDGDGEVKVKAAIKRASAGGKEFSAASSSSSSASSSSSRVPPPLPQAAGGGQLSELQKKIAARRAKEEAGGA